MELCYTGLEECDLGVPCCEDGYQIIGDEHDFQNPRTYNEDKDGCPIGFWDNVKRFLQLTVDFEFCGPATSLPFVLPCQGTIAYCGLISGFGVTTGGVYLENLRIRRRKGEVPSGTFSATRHPNIP